MTNLYYKLTIVYCAFPDNLPKLAFLHHQHLLLSLHAKLLQSCPSLCNRMDCSPPGSSVRGDSPGQEYWSGLPCPPPGDLPDPGIQLASLMFPALAGGLFTTGATWETLFCI